MAAITLNTDLNHFDTKNFAHHVNEKLPNYAVPRFIRIRNDQDITGTFKYKKGDLKKEGFDLSLVNEPMYVLMPNTEDYVPLKKEHLDKLKQGSVCL